MQNLTVTMGMHLIHTYMQGRKTHFFISSPLGGQEVNQFQPPSFIAPLFTPGPSAAIEELDVTIGRLEKIEHEISSLKADLIRRREARTTTPSSGIRTPQAHIPGLSDVRTADSRHGTPVTSAPLPGSRYVEDSTGATIFLGNYSDPPLALGCRRAGDGGVDGSLLDQVIPRTYPFADIWRPVVRAEEICQGLPGDSDVLRYVHLC